MISPHAEQRATDRVGAIQTAATSARKGLHCCFLLIALHCQPSTKLFFYYSRHAPLRLSGGECTLTAAQTEKRRALKAASELAGLDGEKDDALNLPGGRTIGAGGTKAAPTGITVSLSLVLRAE